MFTTSRVQLGIFHLTAEDEHFFFTARSRRQRNMFLFKILEIADNLSATWCSHA